MAVTGFLYGAFAKSLLDGDMVAFDTGVYKVMLCTSSYTPNQDTHVDKADVDNEVVGTGYTAGGVAIASLAATQTLNVVKIDGTDSQWTTSTLTARYAVIYDDTQGADADKKLVGYLDFGEDKSSEAGTFQITWNANGIFTITAADA